MRRSWWVGLALLWGCGSGMDSTSQDVAVQPRPLVNMVPVMDRAQHGLSWDVSRELTQAIRQRLALDGKLYLVEGEARLGSQDPFGSDTFWVKRAFPRQEFIAFVELVDHKTIPASGGKEGHLKTGLRVRVFDLRDSEPKVILQEFVEDLHVVASRASQPHWGDDSFDISPLGIAHAKVSLEVAARIEDYVLMHARP